ncbi:MAG: AAA family ATPase [Candidatus Hadarchaeales archaeon]
MAKTMNGGMIREIILENFMSHTYSRIPLSSGLNLICGPNGAGKSSILLGLSVALGQTYTERSRRLSDLIRRGEDMARVSVVFDNTPENGRRPVPGINSDTVVLSRYLRRDGTYWHEINGRTVVKGEVLRLLGRLSINPDNMLIIMHQNMVDLFGAIDPKERLRLVEEAVGLREYRDRILEAREKLSHTLSEEEATRSLLEKARETMRYWEAEYQRFQRKQALGEKKRELEVEYAWAKCRKQEEAVGKLKARIEELNSELGEVSSELESCGKAEAGMEKKLKEMDFEIESAYQRLMDIERSLGEAEAHLKIGRSVPGAASDVAGLRRTAEDLERKARELRGALANMKDESRKVLEEYIELRVKGAVLGFRRELIEKEMSVLSTELRRARRELEELEAEASQVGERVETERKPQDVLDELKVVNAQLATLADVSPEVERMYTSYKSTLKELEAKAEIAAANRKKALEELEVRKVRWTREITKLIEEAGERYKAVLEKVNAAGEVRVTNIQDIEEAGIEILVGFRGASPQVLDAYTQSGGERTTAIMCFLLALQQKMRSPIRAIDEFEAHLDPRNREAIFRGIIEFMKGEGTQYLVITPGQLIDLEGVPNVITVQNIAGTSQVKVVV